MKKSVGSAVAAAVLYAVSGGSALSEGDAAAGEELFRRCSVYHSIEEGGPAKQGGNLYGVYGSTAGSTPPGSIDSGKLEESGVVWNEETLTEWLKAPARFIPGVRMSYRMTNDKDIADVIAYLKANSPDAQ